MAFGKAEGVRSRIATFRQVTGAAAKTPGRKKGGGIPYFVDMYQPGMNDADTVRLIAGAHLQDQVEGEGDDAHVVQVESPFVKFVDHFDGKMQKSAICSAGPFANVKTRREPCYGCDIYWETAARNPEGKFESTRMSRQNKYAFSILDYSVYHEMEQVDRETGQVRMNQTTKKPYTNWVKCLGQGCDACRAGKPSKVGNTSHWPINYTQLQVLRSTESDIGKSCASCGSVDSIVGLGWMCQGCGECAVDMSTTTLKKDELNKITDELFQCPCGHKDFLTEVYQCQVCAPQGREGRRATLFDVDMKMKLIPGGNGKSLQIQGWSQPRPVPPEFEALAVPVDLVARYGPTPLDIQASKFGIRLQAAPAGAAPPPQNRAPAQPYTNPYGPKTQ